MLLFKEAAEAEGVCVCILLRTAVSQVQGPQLSLWPFPSWQQQPILSRSGKINSSRALEDDPKAALLSASLPTPTPCLKPGPRKLTLCFLSRQCATSTRQGSLARCSWGHERRESKPAMSTHLPACKCPVPGERALPVSSSYHYANNSFPRQRKGAWSERKGYAFLMVFLEARHDSVSQSNNILGLYGTTWILFISRF